jgi:hypothetical protein
LVPTEGGGDSVLLEDEINRQLPVRGCGKRYEILQCSVFGARPEVAVRRAREVLAYAPDVLVVAIGHNAEFIPPPEPLELTVRYSRLAAEAQRFRAHPPAPSLPPAPPEEIVAETYRTILALAHDRGTDVVAVVLGSNLWMRPETTQAYLESHQRAAAWLRWSRGDATSAAALLRSTEYPDSAGRSFERARFEVTAGAWAEARADLVVARDLDTDRNRASMAITTAVSTEARKGGASIVDADAVFSSRTKHGITGWNIYVDNCHPSPRQMSLLADSVLLAADKHASELCGDAKAAEPPERVHPCDVHLSRGWQLAPQGSVETDWSWQRLAEAALGGPDDRDPDSLEAIVQNCEQVVDGHERRAQASALAALGAVARDIGRLDIAERFLTKSRSLEETAPGLIASALLDFKLQKAAEAQAMLEEAGRKFPKDATVQSFLGALSR